MKVRVTRHIVNGSKKRKPSRRRASARSRRRSVSKRARHTSRSTSHKKNRGELTVAHKNKSRKRRSTRRRSSAKRSSHRSNPFATTHRVRRRSGKRVSRRSHRRNPSRMGGIGTTMNAKTVATIAVGAGAGLILTRSITQAALQAKNNGAMGYLGNAAVLAGLTWAGHKFGGKVLGFSVLAGGIAAIVARYWEENVSNVSVPKLSGMRGLSDLMYSSGRVGGLGFVDSFFALPSISQPIPGSPYASVSAPFPQAPMAAPMMNGSAKLSAVPTSRRYANSGRGR